MAQSLSVLFVCLGNICRSPTAEGVFRRFVEEAGLVDHVVCDSAGTAAFHVGAAPDSRSVSAASRRGYDLSSLRARQVALEDYRRFDYILAMDHDNLHNLKQRAPAQGRSHIGLFLDFAADGGLQEVPDPYYGGGRGFEQVLDLVESASRGLLNQLVRRLSS